jgi:uncharacterized protein YecE (DUF72 family)
VGRLRFGTSSWGEKSWVGPFYPKGTRPGDFLSVYASEFDTVEADNTYYGVPRPQMVEGWERKTPDGFTLCAKFPRSVVHGGDAARPDPEHVLGPEAVAEETALFFESMSRLGAKCGPLILQFPFFNRSVFPERDVFLERLGAYLDTLPGGYRYGVELRNKYWIDETLLAFLRERGVALVLVDLAYMPHPAGLWKKWDLVTTDFVYCRLIGDRKAVDAKTKTFDRIVLDQSERLARWAELLSELTLRVPETFVFANNHYAGHGPATIRELAARLGE